MYLSKLVKIIESANIPSSWYGIRDSSHNLLSGTRLGGFEIIYLDDGLHVRETEYAHPDVYQDIKCNSEREACIEFLKMSDDELQTEKERLERLLKGETNGN